MTEEQTGPSADLSEDQRGWVAVYRHGLLPRTPPPGYDDVRNGYEDIYSDDPRTEEETQLRIVEAQMDLLLRFTGASDYDIHADPDSWLETFYALAGKWHGRDAGIDEQLERIDQVLSRTGGPLWRPDLYLPLAKVHAAAVDAVPTSTAPASQVSASSWREPPRLVDWTPDEDPAAGYLRELQTERARTREVLPADVPTNTEALARAHRWHVLRAAREVAGRLTRPRPLEDGLSL